MRKRLLSFLLASIALAANAAETTSGKLPVRRVVLYKNGVGNFEHSERVRGSQPLKIDFTSAQLNGVLKSLRSAGLKWREDCRRGVQLGGANRRATQSLAPKDWRIDDARGLSSMHSRGHRVEVRNGGALVSGRLLSVEEKISRKGQEETGKTLEISVVSAGGVVRTFPLTAAPSVRVADHDLGEEIAKY